MQLIYNALSISTVQQKDPVIQKHTHIYIHIYYTYIIAFSHYPPTFYIPVHILIFRDKEIIFEKANGLHSMFLAQKISEKM